MDSAKFSEKPELQPHFLDYWRIIRLRKSLILTVFLLVVITTTTVTLWLLPERYASKVRMQVEKDQPELGVESRSYTLPWDPYFLRTEFEVITSKSILHSVITNSDLDSYYAKEMGVDHLTMDQTYQLFLKRVTVQQTPNTYLVEIVVKDSDKNKAADLANKIADTYKASRLARWQTARTMGIDAFKTELASKILELKTKETNRDNLATALRIPLTRNNAFFTETIDTDNLQQIARDRQGALNIYNRDNDVLEQIKGTTTFSISSFVDLPSFIEKLKTPADPLSTYLNSKLPATLRQSLINYKDSEVNTDLEISQERLATSLSQYLNALIKAESLYNPERFKGIILRAETKKFLEDISQGESSVRLNRLLLEDAYPLEITRVQAIPPEKLSSSLAALLPPDSELPILSGAQKFAESKFLSTTNALGVNNPDYELARNLLAQATTQLNEKIEGMIRSWEKRVDSEKATYDSLVKQQDEAVKKSRQAQALYRPYMTLNHDVESLRQNIEKLEARVLIETVDSKQPMASIVRITDRAEPGLEPVSPKKFLNILVGVIVGLMVGVGLAFFIEYLDTSIKTIDDVERALEAPVLAVIPQQVGVLLDEGLESPHAEAYRVLRTNLLFARKDENWNTITVLSAGAGEGKSTTLFNLATIFAQNGSRTLVIDSDLCRPSIHKMLRVSNSLGLTDFLLKQKKLEDVIQTTPQPNLDFMPSGKLPRSFMGILSSVQMKQMIKDLKQRYDFVFFDSPPLLGVSDASVLASQMDMILQVIQYRRYPQLMTIRAKQMILKVGGHLMGIVLNNINMSQDENYYYYSGYYEYKSKQNEEPTVKVETASKKEIASEIKPKY